jgi:flagellar biosynthesis/type III secretory pathway protein FliH
VTTNRFAWQAHEPVVKVEVVPVVRGDRHVSPSSAAVTPALRDLPSPSAERIEVAEREAHARGFAEGQQAAEAAAAAQLDVNSAQLAQAVHDLAAVRGVLMRRSERDLVRLAISMAERVLRREVEVDRELLVAMARVAIDRLGDSAAATIHLNPTDHEIVGHRAADLGRSVELVADSAVPRGGCVVKSAFGTIDTGLDSQVKELSHVLLGDDADDEREGLDGAPSDG